MKDFIIKDIENICNCNPDKRFVVHNGFDGWSYGSPMNPMLVTLKTAIKLIEFIIDNKTDDKLRMDNLIEKLLSDFPHFIYAEKDDLLFDETHKNRILSFIELKYCAYTNKDRKLKEYIFELEK